MIRNGPAYSPNGVGGKRPRLEDDYRGYSTGVPVVEYGGPGLSSRVLQVRNLKEQVMEADLIDALSQFGPISYVSLTGRGTALVEFEDLPAAERCMSHVLTSDVTVLQQPAIFSYSQLQMIPRQGWESDRPNNVVVMYVQNPKYPITCDVVSAICKPICRVSRIIINRDNGQIQCLVEFPDIDSARNIKQRLNGCDIYSGCCTLKIEYAKLSRLNVTRNDQDQSDYITPPSALGASPFGLSAKDRPALLQEPAAFNGVGDGSRGPPRDMPPGPPFPGEFDDFRGGRLPYEQPRQPVPGGFGPPPYRGDEFMGGPPLPPSYMGGDGRNDSFGAGRGGDGFVPTPYPPTAGGDARAPDGTGLGMDNAVICFYGINPEKLNCDKLFNVLCQYGNVVRIKFLRTKTDTVMVQMGDPLAADRVIENLNRTIINGNKVAVSLSRQPRINEVREPSDLPDKTTSYKDYSDSRLNRYLTADGAQKNRLSQPQKFVYFYHTPPHYTSDDLINLMEKYDAPKPHSVKIFEPKTDSAKTSAGILEFENDEDAMEAIILANHVKIDDDSSKYPYIVKMCFAGPGGRFNRESGGGMQSPPGGPYNGPARGGRGGSPFRGRGGGGFDRNGGGGFEDRGGFRGGRGGRGGGGDFRGARGGGGGDYRGGRGGGGDYRGGRGGGGDFRGSPRGGEYRGRGGRGGRGRGREI